MCLHMPCVYQPDTNKYLMLSSQTLIPYTLRSGPSGGSNPNSANPGFAKVSPVRFTSKEQVISLSFKHEPAIWSRGTGQRIPCFDTIIQERFITCNNSFHHRCHHQCLLHGFTYKAAAFFSCFPACRTRLHYHFTAVKHYARAVSKLLIML